jgi:protein SCO1/2
VSSLPARRSPARPVLITIGLVAVVGGALAACRPAGDEARAAPRTDDAWSGRELPTALEKPDFTFSDVQGRPFDFRRETEGFVTLLFFGYTNCPDVCPVHLANISAVLRDLPTESARRIKVVFVTTDPERDTPGRIAEWLGAIHPAFVGLRGPLHDVHAAEASLLLPASVVETGGHGGGEGGEDASGDYFVGHASAVVAFAADGLARVMYPWGTRQQDWARDLPRLVREAGPAGAAAGPASGGG